MNQMQPQPQFAIQILLTDGQVLSIVCNNVAVANEFVRRWKTGGLPLIVSDADMPPAPLSWAVKLSEIKGVSVMQMSPMPQPSPGMASFPMGSGLVR